MLYYDKHFRDYQHFSVQHILDNPHCGLFLDMGAGKTASTLTAIKKLMYEDFEVNKVLVIGPKNVAVSVWDEEVTKWDHLAHLKVQVIAGKNALQRKAALKAKADIYVINTELVPWLVSYLQDGMSQFNMIVLDESSAFKNHESKRFRALKVVRPYIKRVVALTGTPAGNGLMDLWAQMYLLDQGTRLGKTITEYRVNYFTAGQTNGPRIYSYELKMKGIEKRIYEKIGDICVSLDQKEYAKLPPLIEKDITIELDEDTKKKYDEFEETQVLKILEREDGEHISAVNATALSVKLRQFSNGAVYEDDGQTYHIVHDQKLRALEEIIDGAYGQSVLVFYQFRHDLDRIQKKFDAVLLKGKQRIADWNAKKIKVAAANPASAAHGLNLQFGGNIMVFYGPDWSLEKTLQAIKRLHRPGQDKPVLIYRLICRGTIDRDVLRRNNKRKSDHDSLMEAIIKKYT